MSLPFSVPFSRASTQQIKPKNVFAITVDELIACGKADHVILMLVDANYIFHNENLEGPDDFDHEEGEAGDEEEEG